MKRIIVTTVVAASLTIGSIISVTYFLTKSRSNPSSDAEKPLSIIINRDPTTIIEFRRTVKKAAEEGFDRVIFPSGEWNWHDLVYENLPTKDEYSQVTYDNDNYSNDNLEEWIKDHKIQKVFISMPDDIEPKLFFMIETTLRVHKIAYWFSSTESVNIQPRKITIQETN